MQSDASPSSDGDSVLSSPTAMLSPVHHASADIGFVNTVPSLPGMQTVPALPGMHTQNMATFCRTFPSQPAHAYVQQPMLHQVSVQNATSMAQPAPHVLVMNPSAIPAGVQYVAPVATSTTRFGC